MPPLTVSQEILAEDAQGLKVTIYSKGEKSRYAKEPAMTVCIGDATIFTRFNEIVPVIYYNDIPQTETAGMPYFNKLADGKISTLPPFTSRQTIRTQNANPVTVHIYSKSESSKYEIYKKVIVKVLKKTIKVWSRRDSKLKGDCRVSQRHIRLIKSPATIRDHNTNLEADITNWAVSDPGNIFCHIDKPYFGRDINSSIHLFNYEEKMLKFSKLLALAIVYKAPGQDRGKIIFATGAGTWDDGAQPLSNVNQHSFAKALEHVVADNNNIKFIAYNNVPPSVPSVKTKSNSKVYKAPGQLNGKIIESTAVGDWDNGAQALSNPNGHSFATALQHVVVNNNNVKFIAYNNAPPAVPNLKTKSNSKGIIILSDAVNTDSAAWIVHTVPGFPAAKTGYNWPVAENARGHLLICLTISESQINAIAASLLLVQPLIHYNDIPKTETAAMPYFNKLAEGKIPTLPPFTSRQTIRTQDGPAPVTVHIYSKSESSKYGAWDNGAQPFTNAGGHSFGKAIEDVVGNNRDIKFLAYNNVPPRVPNLKTKSNSKGIIILSIAAATDSAAWILHTVPGFPAAKTGYSWPVAENARGHLLICLTISESQINAIAASLLLVQPVIYYNDIPQTETAGMPYFNKLAEGKISTLPPFTSRQTIRTQNANPVTVHIYSKSESSKYEIYKKVIAKVLKKTIKVWSRRDSKLKGDCRGSQRHIRLIKSPAAINDHNTNLEADITNWAVSDPGNIFCHIDKPYMKNQTREPAMAVCIDNINIFARFDAIAAQLEDCPK
ncbi:Deoxyribonuclease-2-alpha [Trichinella sp. T6]|nr:Deoxyribonuclease-2-alpha [Trichinella sp. T6]